MKYIMMYCALLALCFYAASALGQEKKSVRGNKNITKRVRESPNFESIKVKKGITVYLKAGEQKIEIEAEDNLIEYIITEVEDNTMLVDMAPGVALVSVQPIKVTIFTESYNLNNIDGASGTNITSEVILKSDSLVCRLSGGSNLSSSIQCHALLLDIQGNSEADLRGSVELATIEVKGVSDLFGRDLSVEQCAIVAEGNSEVRVSVSKEVSAHASGNSNIRYYGNPKVIEKNSSGRSRIRGK